jgi:xylulokinase
VLVGLDVGTTNVKAVAYGIEGQVRAVADERLDVVHPRPGWSEYDPDALFAAASLVLRRVVTSLDGAPIAGVAVASMAETAVPVDGGGRPLHAAVAWHDERSRDQARWWRDAVGEEAVYRITGLPILPIFGVTKLMWFRRHAPDAFARMRAWLNVADYLAYRLSGVQATDRSLASRIMVLDLSTRRWSDELLAACDLDVGLLPALVDSGEHLGGVHRDGFEATGLPVGTPVAAGGHDHPCGALALGLVEPGDVMDSMGTSESLLTVVDAPLLTAEMALSGYQQGIHVAASRAYCNGGLYTSGAAVEWFRSLVAADEPDPYASMQRWAAASPVGSRGVFFLPHLRLASPPYVDADARAAFIGLSSASDRSDLARAVLEGLAFEAQASLDGLLERIDLDVQRLRAVGGGTRNALLMRIKAALLGRPIDVAVHDETSAQGAAMLAGVGAGVYRDTADAVAHARPAFEAVAVEEAWHERYRAAYDAVYTRIYPALAALHHAARALEADLADSASPDGPA